MKTLKKSVSILLSIIMILSVFMAVSMTANAAKSWGTANFTLSNVTMNANGNVTGFKLSYTITNGGDGSAESMIGIQTVPFAESLTEDEAQTRPWDPENTNWFFCYSPYGDFTDYGRINGACHFKSITDIQNYHKFCNYFKLYGFSANTFPSFGQHVNISETISFANNPIDISKNASYYIYMWTLHNGDLYPDAFLGTLEVKNGNLSLKDDNGTPGTVEIHSHSFTYSASGATITATCGEGCDITEGLTLTISAPTGDLTADGTTTFPATLSTGYNTTAFPGTYTIAYTKDGQPYDGTPTEAGNYTASVTVGTATASVSYTVAAPAPEGINYGDDNYIKQDDKVTVSGSDEGKTKFGLNLDEYLNMQMLGIQKKSAIATQGGDDGIRFVTAVNTNLLKGEKIEDYGYIVVKAKDGTSVDKIYENMDKLTYDKVGANNRFTCKGTSNTISGDFGKYDTNTDYKYVTLSLTNTSGSTDTIAARFYIKTTDGNYYYADYIDGNNVTHGGMAFTLPIA